MPLTKVDTTAALVVTDLQKGIVGLPTVHPAGEIIRRAAQLEARSGRKASLRESDHCKTAQSLAGCEVGSYTGGPANWRFRRWGRPLALTFLGLSNRACKFVSIDYRLDCVRTAGPEQVGVIPALTAW